MAKKIPISETQENEKVSRISHKDVLVEELQDNPWWVCNNFIQAFMYFHIVKDQRLVPTGTKSLGEYLGTLALLTKSHINVAIYEKVIVNGYLECATYYKLATFVRLLI